MQSFLAYYEKYHDKIYTYLLYRVGFRREVAEDLTQEVFLKAFDNFSNFDAGRGGFQAWIYRIAHNHLVNFYRDSKSTIPLEEAYDIAGKDDLVASAADRLEAERIFTTLEKLKPDEREILLLRYRQDLSNKELAAVLNKSDGSIRTELSRAISRLKTIYLKLYPQ